jgi:serine/threonine-protein kinase
MPFSANTWLGPYEIKSPLGEGGMGAVYRARDSRLERDVAIKVLHEDGAESPESRSRFEQTRISISLKTAPKATTF